jgi:hypothetical protein
MGFWNKLGKIALTAAPYVAAPFTGGLSLAATGMANKAVQKWSEKDAQKAMAKGLAPSKFDSVLGKVGGYAALGSSFLPTGALGSVGALSKAVGGASKAANIATKVGRGASSVLGGSYNGSPSNSGAVGRNAGVIDESGAFGGGRSGGSNRGIGGGIDWEGMARSVGGRVADDYLNRGQSADPYMNSGGSARGVSPSFNQGQQPGIATPRGQGGVMPRGGFSYNDNPGNQYNQNMPNLAESLFQGRQEAIRNQPFRSGYDVNYGTTEEPQMRGIGPIYPNSGGGVQKDMSRDWGTPKRRKLPLSESVEVPQ